MIWLRTPAGAASSSASMVCRASRQLTCTTIPATISAATGSASRSQRVDSRPSKTSSQPQNDDAARPDIGARSARRRPQAPGCRTSRRFCSALAIAKCPRRSRCAHHHKCPRRRLDLNVLKEQPLDRLVHDPNAGQQQQAGFDEGGEILNFAVAVLVVRIGGLVGNPHREKRDQRRRPDPVQSAPLPRECPGCPW